MRQILRSQRRLVNMRLCVWNQWLCCRSCHQNIRARGPEVFIVVPILLLLLLERGLHAAIVIAVANT